MPQLCMNDILKYRLPKEKNDGGFLTLVFHNELIEIAFLTSTFNEFHWFTAVVRRNNSGIWF